MNQILLIAALFTFSQTLNAEEIFRIEVSNDYKKYSDSDLKRRVWELERAVAQLQQRVFQLEATKTPTPTADAWICTVNAMGDSFVGTGQTKPVASAQAIEKCKSKRGDGFFCKDPKCEQ